MNQVNCPFVGLKKDPDSYVAFASAGNSCFRTNRPFRIRIEHQENCCLTSDFQACPVFQAQGKIKPPEDLVEPDIYRKERLAKRLAWLTVVIVVAIAATLLLLTRGQFLAATPLPTQNQAVGVLPTYSAPSFFSTPLPTDSYQPGALSPPVFLSQTRTPAPTPTDTPIPDIRNIIGDRGSLVIHQILDGESLDLLANQHRTTIAAILDVNTGLKTPLWVGDMIVIPQGIEDTSLLPGFSVLYIAERMTLKSIAQEYNIDIKLLRQYNARVVITSRGQEIILGEQWILLPKSKEK